MFEGGMVAPLVAEVTFAVRSHMGNHSRTAMHERDVDLWAPRHTLGRTIVRTVVVFPHVVSELLQRWILLFGFACCRSEKCQYVVRGSGVKQCVAYGRATVFFKFT